MKKTLLLVIIITSSFCVFAQRNDGEKREDWKKELQELEEELARITEEERNAYGEEE